MAPPPKKRGGRVTPKGTRPGDTGRDRPAKLDAVSDTSGGATPGARRSRSRSIGGASDGDETSGVGASSRYTPKQISKADMPSPRWVPILMWTLFALGGLAIIVNYTEFVWDQSGFVLLGGLGAILAGIMVATQYR
jgi:hypothetical protein